MLLLEMFCLFSQRKALKIQKESTREECQEPWQEHPSPAPPERREVKPALPQAAALSSEKHLPARRGAAIFHICIFYRDSGIQQVRSALSRDTKGLFPH